ncbi:hypothetical protein CYMTET_14177, partial [Cymbomonas tetramitiformis]
MKKKLHARPTNAFIARKTIKVIREKQRREQAPVVEKARDDLPPYIPPTQGRFGVLTDEPELPANVNTILEDDSTDGAYAELHIACRTAELTSVQRLLAADPTIVDTLDQACQPFPFTGEG